MAKRSTDTKAADLIRDLQGQGLSLSKIGKALSRDSSLISQIARGKKPGTNLVSALESLRRKEAPQQPQRRTTKAGTLAKVRKPQTQTIPDKKGRPSIVKVPNKTRGLKTKCEY